MPHCSRRLEAEGNHRNANTIDVDGLPHVGGAIWPGEAVYNLIDTVTGKAKMTKQKGEETAVVDSVTVAGGHKETGVQKVNIRTRYNRNPVIGKSVVADGFCVGMSGGIVPH